MFCLWEITSSKKWVFWRCWVVIYGVAFGQSMEEKRMETPQNVLQIEIGTFKLQREEGIIYFKCLNLLRVCAIGTVNCIVYSIAAITVSCNLVKTCYPHKKFVTWRYHWVFSVKQIIISVIFFLRPVYFNLLRNFPSKICHKDNSEREGRALLSILCWHQRLTSFLNSNLWITDTICIYCHSFPKKYFKVRLKMIFE